MYGIFGLITKKESHYSQILLKKTVERLAILSESRGKDSSGLAFRDERERSINIYKGPISISELLEQEVIRNEFDSVLNCNGDGKSNKLDSTFAVMGHARLVTNGTQLDEKNNQPVVEDGIFGIRNGM